jgi:hypothetical protein
MDEGPGGISREVSFSAFAVRLRDDPKLERRK